MKKFKLAATSLTLMSLMLLSGCGGGKKKSIMFWTGFGGAINSVLEPMLKEIGQIYDVDIKYETKGGYDSLNQSISLSVSNEAYPNIANGYPDHFADYLAANIMVPLDGFINDPEEGIDLSDFKPNYLEENRNMVYQRGEDGEYDYSKPITIGLPWNKSTEVMIANKSFFDVMNKHDETIKVPETWDELAEVGAKIITAVDELGYYGKVVLEDGTIATAIPAEDAPNYAEFASTVAFDFRNVKKEDFRPFSWDSTANFFITAIRQWGGTYTEIGKDINYGYIRFDSAETREALAFFKDLYNQRIIGTPKSFGEALYASGPFKRGECVLTISSSAGADQNIPHGAVEFPFELESHPIPYKDADKKFVISQGTNLAIFDRGSYEDKLTSWKIIRHLTTVVNDEFAMRTSYFPVTKTMQESELYSNFLNADPAEQNFSPEQKIIQQTAKMNAEFYEDEDYAWIRFTDPAFVGSSFVRQEITPAMDLLFAGGKSPDEVISSVTKRLKDYIE